MQAIHPKTNTGDKKQAIYKLFAAYLHTVPLEQVIESLDGRDETPAPICGDMRGDGITTQTAQLSQGLFENAVMRG